MKGRSNIVRTLRHRNFRIYTIGNGVSLVGVWMQRLVTGWLVWELTGSGTWLGLISFADLAPTALLGLVAGAYADRWDRLTVTKVTQLLGLAQALALFALTVTGLVTAPILFGFTLFLGIVMAFNQPARLALVPVLLPRSELKSAVAINSIVFNLARFVGPAVAGLMIATVGAAGAYAANALTFLVFLVALSRLRIEEPEERAQSGGTLVSDLKAGLRYTATHPRISTVLVLLAAISLGGRPLIELLPGFAGGVYGTGPGGLAALTAAVGIGAIAAGLWVGGQDNSRDLNRVYLASALVMAVATALTTLTDSLVVALPLLVVVGIGMSGANVAAQTLVQISADGAMRGRVMSVYGVLFRGCPALGALIMGAASEYAGLRLPVFVGALCLVAAWLWARGRPGMKASAADEE